MCVFFYLSLEVVSVSFSLSLGLSLWIGGVCGKVGGCFGDFRFVFVFVVFFSLSLSLWIGSGRGCGKVGGRPTGGR